MDSRLAILLQVFAAYAAVVGVVLGWWSFRKGRRRVAWRRLAARFAEGRPLPELALARAAVSMWRLGHTGPTLPNYDSVFDREGDLVVVVHEDGLWLQLEGAEVLRIPWSRVRAPQSDPQAVIVGDAVRLQLPPGLLDAVRVRAAQAWPALGLQARASAEAARCPYCHDGITAVDAACAACGTPHHDECLREHGGCAVLGCTRAPGRRRVRA